MDCHSTVHIETPLQRPSCRNQIPSQKVAVEDRQEMDKIRMQDQALCALQRKETLVKEKERNLETAMEKKLEAN